MIHVSAHAIQRFQERVDNIPADQVVSLLRQNRAVQSAISFGATYVKLGTGQRIVLKNGAIVTVLPSDHKKGRMTRERDWRYAGDEG